MSCCRCYHSQFARAAFRLNSQEHQTRTGCLMRIVARNDDRHSSDPHIDRVSIAMLVSTNVVSNPAHRIIGIAVCKLMRSCLYISTSSKSVQFERPVPSDLEPRRRARQPYSPAPADSRPYQPPRIKASPSRYVSPYMYHVQRKFDRLLPTQQNIECPQNLQHDTSTRSSTEESGTPDPQSLPEKADANPRA